MRVGGGTPTSSASAALAQASPTAEGSEPGAQRVTGREIPPGELQSELPEDGVPGVEIPPTLLELAERLLG